VNGKCGKRLGLHRLKMISVMYMFRQQCPDARLICFIFGIENEGLYVEILLVERPDLWRKLYVAPGVSLALQHHAEVSEESVRPRLARTF
jgi:hypothetical protein